MDALFQGCAAIGTTVIVLQFLMSAIGLGHEHGDGGGDGADVDQSHDGSGGGPGDDHASTWIFGVITVRTVAAGLAFFGLTGMAARKADVHEVGVLLLAIGAGFAAFYIVGWITRLMKMLNVDGTVNIHQALDRDAKVYVAIPGGRQGAGKILVEVLGRTLEYQATTPGDPLPAGTEVRVVDILASNLVEVVRVTDVPEGTTGQASAPPPTGGGGEFTRLK